MKVFTESDRDKSESAISPFSSSILFLHLIVDLPLSGLEIYENAVNRSNII